MNMQSAILIFSVTFLLALFAPKTAKGREDIDVVNEASIMEISYLGQDQLPRGIRNNNPGNIEKNKNNGWMGKVPLAQNTDSRFEQFTKFVYGVRAMIRLIRNTYISRYDYNTIELIITKYAPSHENNTRAYINAVAYNSGVGSQELITEADYDKLRRIIQAMANHENGVSDAISDQMFEAAWKIA